MNAIGYLRLSMRDQSRYSLDYQEASVKEYCTRNNIELLAMFKDNGQCSDNFDRPDYIALENFIKKHKGGVNFLIIMDHDRFSRNLPEALMKIKSLENKFRIKVLATNESPDLDTNDPDVFMNRAFKYLMANNELLRIRQRTSRGIRQALESGRFVNLAPFNYLNKKESGGKGLIVLNPDKAFVVKKIFFDFLLGHNLTQIQREANRIGFTGKSHSAITRVLNNCVYAGLVRIPESQHGPEKYIKGIHKPIVTESDFWRCQELLGKKITAKCLPDNDVPLRGILMHTCGTKMTAGMSKGKKKYYLYYRCQKCSNINIPGNEIHEKFQQVLEHLSLSETQIAYIIEKAKEKIKDALSQRKIQVNSKRQELIIVNKKIDGLEEKLVNNEIENPTYKKWYKRLKVQTALLEAEIDDLNKDSFSKWKQVETLLPLLADIPGVFKSANVFQKHSIIRRVFKDGIM